MCAPGSGRRPARRRLRTPLAQRRRWRGRRAPRLRRPRAEAPAVRGSTAHGRAHPQSARAERAAARRLLRATARRRRLPLPLGEARAASVRAPHRARPAARAQVPHPSRVPRGTPESSTSGAGKGGGGAHAPACVTHASVHALLPATLGHIACVHCARSKHMHSACIFRAGCLAAPAPLTRCAIQ